MQELIKEKAQLFGSLLLFTKVFYKIRTGRQFEVYHPDSRESHVITICRELTKVARLQTKRLDINVPPGSGKSTLCQHFIAWMMAQYPDSNFLYISYSSELAAQHTYVIKQIMSLPEYRELFEVDIKRDSSAKDNFSTLQGGTIKAFGSSGSITGQDAGLPNLDRFSGAVIMDDMHKPDEVFSDTMRERVKSNYGNTIIQRPRGPNVPLVYIGHRLHEDDLCSGLISGKLDGHKWDTVILKALDEAGNALAPKIKSREELLLLQECQPYAFAAQYQQDPQPAGGGIFKPEWFVQLFQEPKMLATFITADTAETDKNYNDATVFSFWGLYKIEEEGVETDIYGLHWIDCYEFRVEPKDLENEFRQFYAQCMQYPAKPRFGAIEKKSTGTTLLSVLRSFRGLAILDIQRDRSSGNKTARFFRCQPYVASRKISLPAAGKHTKMVLEHCRKITANQTHRFDDICETMADAIQIALIDEVILRQTLPQNDNSAIVKSLVSSFAYTDTLKGNAYHGS